MLQANNAPPAESFGMLAAPAAQDELDLSWLFGAIRRRLWSIIALMVIGTGIAVAYVALRPANYSAATQLQLTNLKLTFSRDDAFYAESLSDPTFLETQIQIIRSDKVALAVVDSLGLANALTDGSDEKAGKLEFLSGVIEAFGPVRNLFAGAPGSNENQAESPPELATDPRREALSRLQRNYSVERVGLSNIVEIRYTARNRDAAARGANGVAQAYIADQQAARIEAAQSASIWLRERLRDVGPRTRIVAAAAAPKDKSDPRGVLIIAIGCVAGGVVGVALALLRQFLDRTARTPEQAEGAVGAECLGVVPKLRAARAAKSPAPAEANAVAPGGRLMNEAGNRPFGKLALTLQNAKAAVDDKCVVVRARCVGVTSTYSGEGTSTIAVNLARRLALLGERVLLVDCNFARPTLSMSLDPAGGAGLRELACSKSKTLEPFLRSDPASGMKFLPVGSEPGGPALWGDETPRFIDLSSNSYDYVVCDLPPLASIGEVRASAPHFDAFLLVLKSGTVEIDHLKAGLKASGAFREKIAGVILNKARPADLKGAFSPGAAFFLQRPVTTGART